MWSLILYFLFGVASPSHGNHNNGSGSNGSEMVQPYGDSDGDGGDKGNTRPPIT